VIYECVEANQSAAELLTRAGFFEVTSPDGKH
jgi:hypothetical protein